VDRRLQSVWPLLAYTLLTLVMTYPAVCHLDDLVLGDGQDVWTFWWNKWWVQEALTTGQGLHTTPYLFYPQGVSLAYHSFSWLNMALWMLLEPLVGTVAAYNLSVLWVFPLAGWGMERLVRESTGSGGAAFLAGLIYAFVPYRLGQYNHPHLMGTQWIPFYTLYLLRAIRSGRRQHILLASLFLVLTALVGWNLLLYLVIWTAWVAGYSWLARAGALKRLLGVLAWIFAIGGVVLSPLLVPLLAGRAGEDPLGDVQQDWMQTDLLAYVVPNPSHPLWGAAVKPIYGQMGRPRRVVHLGYTVMALFGYGLARRRVRRRTGLWWGGTLLLWVMALGPFLKLHGHVYRSIPLPYYPLSRLFAFQLLKIPDRYNLLLSLSAGVVVGYAVADLLARLRGRVRVGVLVGLSVLIPFEYLGVPVEMQPLRIPRFYEGLARETGEFAIVELPIDFYDAAKRYMLYQTVHGRPIVEGHVSRRPPEATAFLDAHPLLRSLYQTQEIDPALTDVSRQLRALRDAGFRYIIVHKRLTDAEHAAGWQDWLAVAPAFEDQEVVVYRTQPQYGRDFDFVGEVGDGVGLIGAALSTTELLQDGLLEAELVWGTQAAPGRDWLARLALVSRVGSEVQWVDFEPCPGWPTWQWGVDGVARGRATLRADPFVEGGTYTVTVGLVDPATGARVGQPLSAGEVEVQVIERVFERPRVEVPVEALFGDALRLLGYDLRQEAHAVHLALHWQARQRMDVAYKFFVHLLDAETGELVAQVDVVPRDWTYPTTWWESGEVVSDEIALSTSDVPSGVYRVAIGVYDPETGARLPVTGAAVAGEASDHLLLAERSVLP
jgi:hypothetical protein